MSPAPRKSGGSGGRKPPSRKAAGRKTPARKTPARKRKPARATSSVEPAVGSTIASYLIEAPIGRGGMGVLFRAEDQRAATRGRHVALKVLSPALAADDRFRRRFERESQMAASLDHPNIVPVFEAGEDQGVLFIAMRYVGGSDLHGYLEAHGKLDPDRAVAIIGQVGSALDAAHEQGLIHRDVKPANILVVEGGDRRIPHVYLTDFGVTKREGSRSGLTATGQFVGTVEYVAPEQIEGRAVDGRADVYSLGCVLVECLTGRPPFAREQEAATLWAHLSDPPPVISEEDPSLPPAIDAVIERALAKKPEDRYETCGELVDAARSALRAQPAGRVVPPPPPPVSPVAPPPVTSAPSTPPQTPQPTYPAAPGGTPPAGYPQPGRGISTGWIVTIAIGAVALIGLIALIVSLGGDGGGGGSGDGPGPFPSAVERQLLDRIPQSLQTPPCTRASEPAPGSVASVDCFTDTAQLLTYSAFPDQVTMQAAYDARVAQAGVPRDSGDCSQGQPSEDTWVDPAGTQDGRLLCFSAATGTPTIVWTHREHLILAEASRPAGDAVALYEFWTGIADYTEAAPAGP